MKNIYLILFLLSLLSGSAQQWISFGADSIYRSDGGYSSIVSLYSTNQKLYVGGAFSFGGSTTLNCIGVWDNNMWQAFDGGIEDGVMCIKNYKNQLYAGGGFSDASNVPNTRKIARFNGSTWEALPNTYGGLGSTVKDLVVYKDSLIVGTNFPGQPTRICAYDADINNYINFGSVPDNVHALEVYNGELYAGGLWINLKKYVGGTGSQAWQTVGGWCNYYIQDMAVDTFNNFLYVAGGFTMVDDDLLTDNVAIWNGYYWEAIGGYSETFFWNGAETVNIYNGDLYLGLADDYIAGVNTGSLARWDGENWHGMGGLNNGVNALEVWQDRLYIGGSFDTVNGQPQKAIACWEDHTPNCRHLKPRIFTDNMQDTFDIIDGAVQFYNNNAYVDTWAWDFGDTGTEQVQNPTHSYTQTGTYTVSVTVTHGTCMETFSKDITVVNSTAIKELKAKDTGFKIYPNPTKGNLQLTINNEQLLNSMIEILDVNAKVVKNVIARKAKQSIDISALPKGTYFIKIGEQTQQFVKE